MRKSMARRVTALLLSIAMVASLFPMTVFSMNTGGVGNPLDSSTLKPLILQYDEAAPYDPAKPITDSTNRTGWESWALPLGNGHMGAMMFGGTDTERIQLNEKTLWSGGPGGIMEGVVSKKDPASDVFGNVDAFGSGAMQAYIEKLFEDYYNETYTASPAESGALKILPNHRYGLGSYTNFAELSLDLNHKSVSNYRRELNLRTGLSTTTHTANGVNYTRSAFASYPDNVIVYRITADKDASVTMNVRPEIAFNGTAGTVGGSDRGTEGRAGTIIADLDAKTIRLDGVMDNNMKFSGDFYVIPDGGTMTAENPEVAALPNSKGAFNIAGANSVTIIVALATNYKNEYPAYRQADPDHSRKDVAARIAAVKEKSFDNLYKTHFDDYNALFSRTELDLGGTYTAGETTDKLLSTWKTAVNSGAQNHYLEELYFQYGRYMLMSSSREGTLPANLQGVWADQSRPAWQSDYHTNINLQMNYWPAYTTNLAETGVALLNYVDSLRAPGAVTAKMLYGVDDTWMVNCSASSLGFTGNINSAASLATTASAFILQNVYDTYEFTQDKQLLASTLYPIMKDACKLFVEILQPGRTELDKDRLFLVPSFSSEHGKWTVGASFDQQLIYMLFADTVSAAKVLGVDAAFVTTLEDKMARLHPIEIGLDGQIKEYQQEGKYLIDIHSGTTIPGIEKAHRHNSQLMVLHPGDMVNTETPAYMAAAEKTLNFRGDGASGWSMGQKFNMWARLHDGNRAYNKLFVNLMKNGTYNNLFDKCPPFQIDGNFGGTQGLVELLMQSHAGYVDILPALPDAMPSGHFSGMVAEGNFELALSWANKQATALSVTARSGGTLNLKAGALSKIMDDTAKREVTAIVHNEDGSIGFATEKGHTYSVTFAADSDLAALTAKVNEFSDFSTYAYTGETATFASVLTTAKRVLAQGNYYVPTVNDLTAQLDTAFAALTARDGAQTGAVLALRLKDMVEAIGISTEKQNAYRVHVGPVIAKTEKILESSDTDAMMTQGLELVLLLDQYGKDLAPREGLYSVLAAIAPLAADNVPLQAALALATAVFCNPAANAEELTQAMSAAKAAAAGVIAFWRVSATAQAGGTISPQAVLDVTTGSTLTFQITPNAGNEIHDVLVNGMSVGSVATYTLRNIHEDTEIIAKFTGESAGSEEAELLKTAILLAESRSKDSYQDFTIVEAALAAANAAQEANDAEKAKAADALLEAIDALVPLSSPLKRMEAEAEGHNIAWDDSWKSAKSGAPEEPDVQVLLKNFRDAGKHVISGYGKAGKTHSKTDGSTNMQWGDDKQAKFSGGNQLTSRAKDPWLQYTFVGNRIALMTETAQTACMADIYIDDKRITTVDLSSQSNPSEVQRIVFDSAAFDDTKNLAQGEHTLRIMATGVGTISAAQAPYQILRVDAFQVYSIAEKVAMTTLAHAIAKAGATDTRIYTAESLLTLTEKLEQARAVLCLANVSAQAITDATNALEDAITSLGKASKTITAVINPAGQSLLVGTALAKIELPETVTVLVEEAAEPTPLKSEEKLPVQWDTADYGPYKLGTQTIRGRILIPASGVFANPGEIIAELTLTLKDPSANTFALTATAGAGGKISPHGTYAMSLGMNQTFTLTPDAGYEIFDVTVNGKSAGAVSRYTAANLTENTEIVASFRVKKGESGAVKGDTLLRLAIELAEKLTENAFLADSWATMQTALSTAKAESGDNQAKLTAANALLTAMDDLKKSAERLVEAESEGLNVAWDDGSPANVDTLIQAFQDAGNTIIVGYGPAGKVASATGRVAAWETQSHVSGAKQLISRAKDPWIQFTFSGERVAYIAEIGTLGNTAHVYLDDMETPVTTLTMSAASTTMQKVIFDSNDYDATKNLAQGEHTLKICVQANQGNVYEILRADAFRVHSSEPQPKKSAIADGLADAMILDLSPYSPASKATFEAALSAAKTAFLAPTTTQAAVDAALAALTQAKTGLEKIIFLVTEIVAPADIVVMLDTAFDTIALPATVTFKTAGDMFKAPVTWDPSAYDPAKTGTQTITGALTLDASMFRDPENRKANVQIRVVSAIESVTLDKAEHTMYLGENVTLRALITPENATNKNVVWSSTNEAAATVAGGVVTAHTEGSATIIATAVDGGKYASCQVTVKRRASSAGSDQTIKTEQNADGSTSTIVTDKKTGTAVETARYADGSKVITTTTKDGAATCVVTVSRAGEKTTVTIPTAQKPAPGTVAVMVRPDGSKEVIKTSVATADGMRVTLTEGASIELTDNSKLFADVKPSDWHSNAVAFATSRELFNGTSSNRFSPSAPMTRAMLMTVLYRYDGASVKGTDKTWYADAMAWAKEIDISDGTNPNGSITREQLATILYRYAQATPPDVTAKGATAAFADSGKISPFAAEAMTWAIGAGLITGKSSTQMDPQAGATRAEVATILMRFCENIVK